MRIISYLCENPEPTTSGKNGIKGAHRKDNFINEAKRVGARIIDTTTHPTINGVEDITYSMPKKDKYGNPTGQYQAKTHHKTVYDPSIISTETYVRRGLQAANNAAKNSQTGKLGREWTGTDDKGVRWHGYCDKNGNITSFYPDD